MKVKKYLNKKGFTLVELLAVIVILSIVLGITIYVATSLINNAKEKTYQTTINNIEKKSGSYLAENSDRLFFLAKEDDSNEYQCITVKNLIDYGYLDNTVIKSKISNNKTVTENDYIYVERNINSKAITKVEYIYDLTSEAAKTCDIAVSALGDIVYSLSPSNDTWAREKTLTITYKINNLNDVNTAEEYIYGFTYNGNSEPNSAEDNSVSKTINVTSNGTMNGYIKAPKLTDPIASSEYDISKIDREGPALKLGTNEIKTVKRTVTIPIIVTDSDSGVNYASFTKEDIEVTIGNTSINNFTLNKKDNSGNYELTINDTNNDGKVTIKVKENSIYDNVVDAVKNGNEETTLTTNITFDSNYTVEIKVINGTGGATKTVKYNEQPTFTVGANTGYGDPTVSCTNSQTASISGTTVTTGKITNNTICTVTYKLLAEFSFGYTGKFKICTGSNYGTCTTKTNASYSITSKPWAVYFLTSGTLTVNNITSNVDIFLVSGAASGAAGYGDWPSASGGVGGKGGIWYNVYNQNLKATSYAVTIGDGGVGDSSTTSSVNGAHSKIVSNNTSISNISISTSQSPNSGNNRKSGGNGGLHTWAGADNAGNGTDGVYPFDSTKDIGLGRYAGGGGGGKVAGTNGTGNAGSGGAGGGANGCTGSNNCNASTNTGGGGGGGFASNTYKNYASQTLGGSGGSGIIIIRNK